MWTSVGVKLRPKQVCVCVHEEDACLCVGVWLLGVGDGELRDRGVGLDEEKKAEGHSAVLDGKALSSPRFSL